MNEIIMNTIVFVLGVTDFSFQDEERLKNPNQEIFLPNKLYYLNDPLLSCAKMLAGVIFNWEQNIHFGKCSVP